MLCHGEQQLVAVVQTAVRIDDQHAIAVTVEGYSEICFLKGNFSLKSGGRRRAEASIDVHAVGLDADRHHVGAQLVEYAWRDRVGRAVRAIDDELQALQVELAREGRLAELDVA